MPENHVSDVSSLIGKSVTHKVRHSRYKVVGVGRIQTAAPISDETEVVVYQGEDGKLWVRPTGEFCDGRFTT